MFNFLKKKPQLPIHKEYDVGQIIFTIFDLDKNEHTCTFEGYVYTTIEYNGKPFNKIVPVTEVVNGFLQSIYSKTRLFPTDDLGNVPHHRIRFIKGEQLHLLVEHEVPFGSNEYKEELIKLNSNDR